MLQLTKMQDIIISDLDSHWQFVKFLPTLIIFNSFLLNTWDIIQVYAVFIYYVK